MDEYFCIYPTVLRYCGQALGTCDNADCTAMKLGPVTSSDFQLTVVTDDDEMDDKAMPPTSTRGNRGFQLFFKQLHC